MKSKLIFWWLAVVIVIGSGAGFAIWRQKKAAAVSEIPTVRVVRGNMRLTVLTTGTVKPQNRLEIKSPIAGRVEEILVREGESMVKGRIMAWLSSTERAALLDAARAKGTTELVYWEGLYRPTPLVAPIDGSVIARNIEPGQTVTAQDVLLVMSDRLIVEAQIDETDIAGIAIGQRAEITLDAYPDQAMSGEVDHIAYEAKTVNNVTMYMVDVLPHAIPEFLRSGMTANVMVIMAEKNDVLLLPADAIISERGSTMVQIHEPDFRPRQSSKRVRTGISDGRNVEIVDGLEDGDVVIRRTVVRSEPSGSAARNPFMPVRPGRR